MAGNNLTGGGAERLADASGIDYLPASVEKEAFADARADRNLAFAEIAFHLGRLGLNTPRHYRFPLDGSRERSVLVVPEEDFRGHRVWHTYVNDEVPHPNPALMDVRRLHMSVFATRLVGKEIVHHHSYADRVVATGTKWYATGKFFVGPYLAHDRALGIVDVRGRYPYVQPDLPPIDANPSAQQVLDRTENASVLARTLAQLDDIYAAEADVFINID